jgi:hypothetical protein
LNCPKNIRGSLQQVVTGLIMKLTGSTSNEGTVFILSNFTNSVRELLE